jgi:hypothetical protein
VTGAIDALKKMFIEKIEAKIEASIEAEIDGRPVGHR